MSKLTDIRDTCYQALLDISTVATPSGIGQDSPHIYDYLVDWEVDETKANYLNAEVEGAKKPTTVGLQVLYTLEQYTSNNWIHNYDIRVDLYYPLGEVNNLIDAYNITVSAILGSNITCELQNITTSTLDITKEAIVDTSDQELIRGSYVINGRYVGNLS